MECRFNSVQNNITLKLRSPCVNHLASFNSVQNNITLKRKTFATLCAKVNIKM